MNRLAGGVVTCTRYQRRFSSPSLRCLDSCYRCLTRQVNPRRQVSSWLQISDAFDAVLLGDAVQRVHFEVSSA